MSAAMDHSSANSPASPCCGFVSSAGAASFSSGIGGMFESPVNSGGFAAGTGSGFNAQASGSAASLAMDDGIGAMAGGTGAVAGAIAAVAGSVRPQHPPRSQAGETASLGASPAAAGRAAVSAGSTHAGAAPCGTDAITAGPAGASTGASAGHHHHAAAASIKPTAPAVRARRHEDDGRHSTSGPSPTKRCASDCAAAKWAAGPARLPLSDVSCFAAIALTRSSARRGSRRGRAHWRRRHRR